MNPETGHIIVTEDGESMPAGYWPVPPDIAKLYGLLPERKLEPQTDFSAELMAQLEEAVRAKDIPSESEKAVTAEEDMVALRRKFEELSADRR